MSRAYFSPLGKRPHLALVLGARDLGDVMQRSAEQLPIVRCPGCEQPMEPRERTPILSSERLVDIRYVCRGCGMETKRTIMEDS